MSGWFTRGRVASGVGVALLAGGVAVAATSTSAQPTLAASVERPAPLTTSSESPGLDTLTRMRIALATGTPGSGNPIGAAADSRDDELFRASATGSNDLPDAARRAYQQAARTMATTSPGCGIGWTLLAGIGRVESDHGRFAGSELGSDGVSRPAIIGIALDGVGPVAAISDTDGGRLDGDKVWDRAVGPMQFIPSTWATSGRDGDGDGVSDPGDLDDASLAAAAYLCRAGGDLTTRSGQRSAVLAYNPSDYYVDLVLAFKRGYDSGDFTIPTPPADDPAPASGPGTTTPVATDRGPATTTPATPETTKGPSASASEGATDDLSADLGGSKGSDGGNGKPSKGTKPSKGDGGGNAGGGKGGKRDKTVRKTVSGTWFASGSDSWRVGNQMLDLSAGDLGSLSTGDYDNDGKPEELRTELNDLNGVPVKVSATVRDGVYTVTAIGGVAYP